MLRVAEFAAASDVGRVRKANEDSYYVRSPLFVVADGMGGANAGEVASKIAVDSFKDPLDDAVAPEPRMAGIVRTANRLIHKKSNSSDEFKGMGTTVTALLLGDDELTIAHVGDSRAYRLRDGDLERLTRDHSLVGEMVRRGAITEAEAEVHPQRSILTRALGPEDDVEIDTLSHGVKGGDIYLICSDGLTGMVDEATIATEMGSGRPMQEIAESLIRKANENGGVDNITVIAFTVDGESTKSPQAPSAEDAPRGDETIIAPAVVVPAAAAQTPTAEPARPADTPPARPQTVAGANGSGQAPPTTAPSAAYAQRRAESKKSRRWVGAVIVSIVLLIGISGAVVGSLNVYFIGGNEKGLVTVYRGLPYELPLSIDLYTRDFVTNVPVSELPAATRARILDHKLRTRTDALDLARQIEKGEIKPASVDGVGATAP
ncbi:MAG: Stp1/IreP family PP2C-type Ser/Thr phosphatase [Solirubrobacterales bacterium]|nr:Stp1/IreP family PP2C-type Ser/Thr phosphatase [Solirubrobacterales bacterium]